MKKHNAVAFLAMAMIATILGGMFIYVPSEAKAIGISPVLYDDLILDPGESTTRTIRVYNNTDYRDTYYFYAKNFTPTGEEGNQAFKDESIGLQTWVQVPEEYQKITLESWEDIKIVFRINVPADAEPGGHYAALFVTKRPPNSMDASGVGLESEVGLLLLVSVNGEIQESATLREFGIVKEKSRWNRLPTVFFSRIENTGNVHFKPQGEIIIKNLLGWESARIPANPKSGNVLPRSIRRFESTWLRDWNADQSGNFFVELKNEFKNFALGRYTAELNMEWSATQAPLTATVAFWVFPWRVMILALLVLFAVILAIRFYNKMVIRWEDRRRSKSINKG